MRRSLLALALMLTFIAVDLPLVTPPALAAQSAAPVGSSAEHPARVSGGVMAGLVLDHPDPEYPQSAREKHLAGAVVLHVIVTPRGNVDSLSALTGPQELRDAAVAAVRDWTYKPYQLNGRPVYVETTVTINFKPLDVPTPSPNPTPTP